MKAQEIRGMGISVMGKGEISNEETRELLILKHAVENTNEAFVTIDQDHKVLVYNKAAERIFGYGADEVVGNDLNVIMVPTCSRNHREAVNRYVKTGIPGRIGHETEIKATRKNGEIFPASISFSVTEVEGKLFFTGIVRDMTETRALQQKLLQSERLAALGQIVAEITHEIKNPLMMIGGFARQLVRSEGDETHLKKLRVIADEVKRLEELLADLRDFYLPKAIVNEAVNLESLFTEIYSLVKDDCEKKDIRAGLTVDQGASMVRGDKARLTQVFMNVIKNAVEAMKDGGNLSIKTKGAGNRVEISVTDDGCGIPESDRSKIFSPFFTNKERGTGLGLSVSKRIIDEHENSSFSVESQVGKGTTFKITLPAYLEKK